MLNRISALLILFALCANSLLIYRSKHHHRPKLVCYAVPPDAKIDPQRHPSYPETTGTGAEPHPTKDKLTRWVMKSQISNLNNTVLRHPMI